MKEPTKPDRKAIRLELLDELIREVSEEGQFDWRDITPFHIVDWLRDHQAEEARRP